ncbi:MAG: hypothetical protein JW751_04330 [Polyangiaceae bacterium]|nr:hypothetical protein [Polyangiaceae bacterium]
MSVAIQSSKALLAVLLAVSAFGCEKPAEQSPAPAKPSVAPKPVASTAPVESAKPPPKPREDCPEGSSGIGTFDEPCMASGASRMMKVEYTGKTTDEGPKFAITNLSKNQILYGSIVAYFYDKAGKQLPVADSEKPRPKQTCSGANIFAGAVKPDEKVYMFFSCIKKSHVPEGTATIEAEVQTVGFADSSGEKNDFYWKNPDLVPDERPKGGLKPGKATPKLKK